LLRERFGGSRNRLIGSAVRCPAHRCNKLTSVTLNLCYLPAVPRAAVTLALLIGLGVLDVQAGERSAVSVLLTTAPIVSPAARIALMREATGIWARAGIRLAWVSPAARPAGLSLRVLTVDRSGGAANSEDTWVLGELVRGAGTTAVAMIALDQVTAIATRARSARASSDADQRLGLVLGRIIAHEIGHFLLAASPHQTEGLMRARYPEAEVTDPWSATFELNAPMKTVAHATFVNGFPARVPAAVPTAVSPPTSHPTDSPRQQIPLGTRRSNDLRVGSPRPYSAFNVRSPMAC
jgi:hypothetical protein